MSGTMKDGFAVRMKQNHSMRMRVGRLDQKCKKTEEKYVMGIGGKRWVTVAGCVGWPTEAGDF